MPICRVCSSEKEADGFYPRQLRKCGTVGECKDCTKARVRQRARTNPSVQEYDRKRASLPHRRELMARINHRWNERNPEAYRAHYLVTNAVRDGRLAKEACLFCGREDVHAHHRDYAKPLDVIWLCPKCHHRLHAAFPEAEGLNKSRGDAA